LECRTWHWQNALKVYTLELNGERSAFLHCQCSALQGAGIETHDLPCRKCNTNHWNNTVPGIEKWGLFFPFIEAQSQRGPKFKIPAAEDLVLSRAALSGPKPAPDRARQGVFRNERRPKDRVTLWIALLARVFPTFWFVFSKLCIGQTCYTCTGIECINHLTWVFFLPSLTNFQVLQTFYHYKVNYFNYFFSYLDCDNL
jgi:hypothetical protein